jgi:hypothetical protein
MSSPPIYRDRMDVGASELDTSAIDQGIAAGWIEAPRLTRVDHAIRHRSDLRVVDVLDEDRC